MTCDVASSENTRCGGKRRSATARAGDTEHADRANLPSLERERARTLTKSSSTIALALGVLGVACADPSDHPPREDASTAPCTACADAGAGGAPDRPIADAAAPPSAGGGEAGAAGEAGAGGEAGEAGAPSADDGVSISEISFWQTVRVPLEIAGAPVPPNAPLVAGKEGMLRVSVSPGQRFRARTLSVALELGTTNGELPLTSTKWIRGASEPGQFTTTFNFPIDAAHVLVGSNYSVTLQDGAGGPELDRYPAAGRTLLQLVSAGDTLNVVVVPIVVGGILPDVSARVLEKFRARVLSMYPLADLTLTTHAPLTSSVAVGPDRGWDQTLDALYALRAADAPADNVYYYGLFTPTKRYDDYCTSSCTVGLSQVAAADEVEYRGSIGLGLFADGSNSSAPDTMAHELGHALGRFHAPCMTPDPGPFPYPGGKLGVWGFDSLNHLLLEPNAYADVMGYCSPDWISDYTYKGLFDRIQRVNAEVSGTRALTLARDASVFRRVLVDARGGLHWGSAFTLAHAPHGEPRELLLLARDGRAFANVTGYFQPYSDAPGGFLLVPAAALAPEHGIAAIRLGNAELALGSPLP